MKLKMGVLSSNSSRVKSCFDVCLRWGEDGLLLIEEVLDSWGDDRLCAKKHRNQVFLFEQLAHGLKVNILMS